MRDVSIALHQAAADYAPTKGIICRTVRVRVDENGALYADGQVLTPDSSRYWPLNGYEAVCGPAKNPPSYDKQYLRDWLENRQPRLTASPWNKTAPSPTLRPPK